MAFGRHGRLCGSAAARAARRLSGGTAACGSAAASGGTAAMYSTHRRQRQAPFGPGLRLPAAGYPASYFPEKYNF